MSDRVAWPEGWAGVQSAPLLLACQQAGVPTRGSLPVIPQSQHITQLLQKPRAAELRGPGILTLPPPSTQGNRGKATQAVGPTGTQPLYIPSAVFMLGTERRGREGPVLSIATSPSCVFPGGEQPTLALPCPVLSWRVVVCVGGCHQSRLSKKSGPVGLGQIIPLCLPRKGKRQTGSFPSGET